MTILGVDTSSTRGCLCLYQDGKKISQKLWTKKGSHSELVTTYMLEILQKKKLTPKDIQEIYCVTGPGSFTGIRVGVNFAKTLAYSLNVPVVPVNALEALAITSEADNTLIASMIDGQRNAVFFSLFDKKDGELHQKENNLIVPVPKLDKYVDLPMTVCGDGYKRYEKLIPPSVKAYMKLDSTCEFAHIGKVIEWNLVHKKYTPLEWKEVKPLYLRPSAAEEKLLSHLEK